MYDLMDSRFYMRRILVLNVCWILLSFLHVGVKSQKPTFEISGSGMINTAVNFTCISNTTNQFYVTFYKGDVKICMIPENVGKNIEITDSYINRITPSRGPVPGSNTFKYSIMMDSSQCSDEGEYTCEINDSGNLARTVENLSIKSMPRMPTLTAAPDLVVLGDVLTFECTAIVGKPARNLSLCVEQGTESNCTEFSKPVDLGNCSFTQTTSMTINITEDTNRATCAVLPEGDLKVIQTWEVHYPILDIKFVPDDSVLKLTEGESRVITCEARGNPTPSFRWDFQPTIGDVITSFRMEKVLYLSSVRLDQNGIYTCIASNEIRNVTHNMTKSITVNIVPTTPAPTTPTIAPSTEKTSPGTNGNSTITRPLKNDDNDDWKLIVGVVCAVLFLLILIGLLVVLYRRRSKPAEIEEPPEKPRNNHEVNMRDTEPDLIYSTGIEKGKFPMYNTGFDHHGEDDLNYAELAFDDKPRSRKPIVPLYENSSNNDPYKTVMPHV